ncbi:hypothetical protein BGM19_23460 [Streptomyces agglomeratus]|uniref:hypothetical protein n=1 Tax=Streptomyces agglomeratus TaxID=285458 RepID=UPI00086929D4|nr:hypothetical protein [Streptomyces agglomeratus]OEJ60518.1 hypothetical protein BGM19_23460 [Streptomyces agglomeratus]
MKSGLTRLAALAALCAALGGCGIRTTSVPVDAGAAPSRVPCELSAQDSPAEAAAGVPLQVYLVCGAQLVSVDRTVRVPEEKLSDRLRVAQTLLAELKKEPANEEKQAGFTTDVRETLAVSGAREGDPRDALRLSSQPEDLPTHALAQIVCTYADSAAAGPDRSVVLGGPSDDPVREYQCTAALKARPESVLPTLGEIRPSGR